MREAPSVSGIFKYCEMRIARQYCRLSTSRSISTCRVNCCNLGKHLVKGNTKIWENPMPLQTLWYSYCRGSKVRERAGFCQECEKRRFPSRIHDSYSSKEVWCQPQLIKQNCSQACRDGVGLFQSATQPPTTQCNATATNFRLVKRYSRKICLTS